MLAIQPPEPHCAVAGLVAEQADQREAARLLRYLRSRVPPVLMPRLLVYMRDYERYFSAPEDLRRALKCWGPDEVDVTAALALARARVPAPLPCPGSSLLQRLTDFDLDAVVLPPPHPFLGGTQPATDHSLSYEAQAPPLLFGAEADAASFRRQAQAVMAQQRREEALLEERITLLGAATEVAGYYDSAFAPAIFDSFGVGDGAGGGGVGPEAQPEEEDASEPEGEEEGGEDEGEGEEVEEEAGEVDDPLSPAAIASRLLSISVRDRPAEPRSRWAPDLALADVD